MQLVHQSPPQDDLAEAMRQFIIGQGAERTAETAQRYVQVADDLEIFLATVDVRPWLGAEIGAYLDDRRRQLGAQAFLPSLGLASLIRVLPAFAADPWLPPPGAQRRTHRAAVRYLITFLRARAMQDGCLVKSDFRVIDKALGSAYQYDRWTPAAGRVGTVTCSVTLELVTHLVDRMLEDITEERYETLDEAIAARLNPVKKEIWVDPEPYYRDYR